MIHLLDNPMLWETPGRAPEDDCCDETCCGGDSGGCCG